MNKFKKSKNLNLQQEIIEIQKAAEEAFGVISHSCSYQDLKLEFFGFLEEGIPLDAIERYFLALNFKHNADSYLACFYLVLTYCEYVKIALLNESGKLAGKYCKTAKIYLENAMNADDRMKEEAKFRTNRAINAGFSRAKKNTEAVVAEAIRLLMQAESKERWKFKEDAIVAIAKPLEDYIKKNEISIKGGVSLVDRLRVWSRKFSELRDAFESAKIKRPCD